MGTTAATVAMPNRHSDRLFVLFTGNAEQLMIDPLRFFQLTAIAEHNILLCRDPYRAAYRRGISDNDSGLDGIVACVKCEIETRFPHVTRLFCVGTSSGGLPAIYCGHSLDAEAVFCFGARIARNGAVAARDAVYTSVMRELLGRDVSAAAGGTTLTLREQYIVQRGLQRDEIRRRLWEVAENPANILDYDMLCTLVRITEDRNGRTPLYLYYSPANAADCAVAEAFRHAAGVVLHALTTATDPVTMASSEASHFVVNILEQEGRLPDVFRDYV